MRLTISAAVVPRPLIHRALLADARHGSHHRARVFDTAPERVAVIRTILEQQREAHRAVYGEPPLTVRGAPRRGVAGSAIVFSAVRVGGAEARSDERWRSPLEYSAKSVTRAGSTTGCAPCRWPWPSPSMWPASPPSMGDQLHQQPG